MEKRAPILYISAGVDLNSTGDATIAWFKRIDRARWAPSLITTEPSPNRGLAHVEPLAEEIWELPALMNGGAFPEFILGFVETRNVRLVHIMGSHLGFDLLPDMASVPEPPSVVAQLRRQQPGDPDYVRYVPSRYGNLIDVFSADDSETRRRIAAQSIPLSRIEVIDDSGPADGGMTHSSLNERLLAERPATSRWRMEHGRAEQTRDDAGSPALARPMRFPRDPRPAPSVSVGVPCFRHGIYLDSCIRSIKLQFLKPTNIVVVDDGSDDAETIEALERYDRDPKVTVLRQPGNLGPSAARNRALEHFDTSYALWLDADDALLPGALDSMVAKLEAAPESVGFIYPHAKHMGNRSDVVEMPAFNLWLLMQHNICPSPCLFDLRAFTETGIRYPEELVVGHEDWDIILQLAEREIHGLHADGPTFLYRKQGFSRVHAVDYGPDDFHTAIEARHPSLYLRSSEIKGAWAPALSIILMDSPAATWSEADLSRSGEQTCLDFELLAQDDLGGRAKGIGVDQAGEAEWLQEAVRSARGRWICLLTPPTAGVFTRPAFVEKLMRALRVQADMAGIVLATAPGAEGHSLSLLSRSERQASSPRGIAFERPPGAWIPRVELGSEDSIVADLAMSLQAHGVMQWRLAPSKGDNGDKPTGAMPVDSSNTSKGDRPALDLNYARPDDRPEATAKQLISLHEPDLPALEVGTIRRWKDSPDWTPPDTQHLARHRHLDGPARIVTNDRNPPPGFELEFDLGVTHFFAAPDTLRLVSRAGTFELSEEQDEPTEGRALGYVSEQALPLCERLELREMPETAERVLVAGREDPLFAIAKPLAPLGWVVPFPIPPRGDLFKAEPWRAARLLRVLDISSGRHRYDVSSSDEQAPEAVSLGAVLKSPGRDLVALRLRGDGRLASDLARPGRASRDPRKLARWAMRPPPSSGGDRYWPPPARVRYLARHWLERRLDEDDGETVGWLRREVLPGSRPIFSTTHPATGDQLVTCDPGEAVRLGYLPDGILGFVLDAGNENGAAAATYTVPWASA